MKKIFNRLYRSVIQYSKIREYHFVEKVTDEAHLVRILSTESIPKLSFSLRALLGMWTDLRRVNLLRQLDELYYKKAYSEYLSLIQTHIHTIIYLKKTKYLSWAGLVTKGTELSKYYLGKAVSLHPIAINDITTSIIIEGYPDKTHINAYLRMMTLQSKKLTPLIFCYVILKDGEEAYLRTLLDKAYFVSKLDTKEHIELLSALNMPSALIQVHEKDKNYASYDIKTFERVYDAYTREGQLEHAKLLFDIADKTGLKNRKTLSNVINPHVINNKLERHYWFAKGDLVKAYGTYRRQNLAQVLSVVFPHQYTQSTVEVIKSRQPLIFASWGPGDEIRFSKVYTILVSKNPAITVTCEPRLHKILCELYPAVNFLPVNRTRRVNNESTFLYDALPHPKLHHLMDNALYQSIKRYDTISMLTDLLSEQINSFLTLKTTDNKSPMTIINDPMLKAEIEELKNTQRKLVGISWRSSIMTTSRNEHYFTIEQLLPLLKLEGVTFVNLQYGDCTIELDELKTKYNINVHNINIDHYNDFYSVINLMQELDVIVSAGTTVLELAGLSGTQTYALTNNHAMLYRVNEESRDLWFNNIHYVPLMTYLTKREVVTHISTELYRVLNEDKTKVINSK
ncbi:hypothetical protein [Photobacterium profundum]|nr:hypothetical protein [Photobacterium profundum]